MAVLVNSNVLIFGVRHGLRMEALWPGPKPSVTVSPNYDSRYTIISIDLRQLAKLVLQAAANSFCEPCQFVPLTVGVRSVILVSSFYLYDRKPLTERTPSPDWFRVFTGPTPGSSFRSSKSRSPKTEHCAPAQQPVRRQS